MVFDLVGGAKRGGVEREHTARITKSIGMFVALRPIVVAMALDQDEVSSVVVLFP